MAGEYSLNLSNGSLFATLYPLEVNGPDNVSTPRFVQEARPQYLITSASVGGVGAGEFQVLGDFTSVFQVGFVFQVVGSTGNDGAYTVDTGGVSFNGTHTVIVPAEAVASAVADGSLIAHVFKLVGDLTFRFVSGFTFNVSRTFTPDISGVNTGLKEFTIAGDYTLYYTNGITFTVSGSTGNDGTYTVVSSSFAVGDTTIVVVEVIPSAVVDGTLSGVLDKAYTVTAIGSAIDGDGDTYIPVGNTNIRDNDLTPIGLPFGEISYTILDSVSSLQLPGRGTLNYGEKLIENMMRMMENFADDSSPDTNSVIGTTPAATPLTGQLWYNTTSGSEGFNVWDGSAWTPDTDLDTGALIFRDLESVSTTDDIFITASETNLPAPWPGAANNQSGLVVWQQTVPVNDTAIFRVLSSLGEERLRVEHHATANSGYIRSVNNLELTSTGESYFHGQVGIGDNGLPTIERTLTVEGDGISVNSDAATDARIVIDAPTGQTSSIDFEVNNVPWGNISADGSNFLINSAVAIDVAMVTGGGDVGINQLAPSARLDVVGTTELNGKTNVVSADFIVGIDGTGTEILSVDDSNSWVGISTAIVDATDVTDAMEITGNLRVNSQIFASDQTALLPTYTFTSDPNTGMYNIGPDQIGFTTAGTLALSIIANGVLQVPAGYEALLSTDNDIPNKKYVDDLTLGDSWREPVRVRDDTAYANQAAFPTGGTIDGVTLAVNDRVLFAATVVVGDRDIFVWNGATWDAVTTNTQSVGDTTYVKEGSSAGTVFSFDDNDAWEPLGSSSGINVLYEVQTAIASQTVFSLASISYGVGTNRLQVYVDGVKQIVDVAYTESSPTVVTFLSGLTVGQLVEFIAFEELTANAVAKREEQTGLTGTPLITFATLTYQQGSDNLLVFLNGQKMVKAVDYNETTDTSITWIGTALIAADLLEFYSSVPIVAGTSLRDIENVSVATPNNADHLIYNGTSGEWEPTAATASAGVGYDYITGVASTVLNTVTVNTTATTSVVSFQQVFVNGVLQREDVIAFPATGNYYVSGAKQITFATALVASDEVTLYQL